MNDLDRIQQEVAEGERWFAGVCDPSPRLDTARIKQTVAVATQEAWLAGQDAGEIPSALSLRIKVGVRAELVRSRHRPRRWSLWFLGASSAAAMVTVGVISFQRDDEVRLDDSTDTALVASFGALDDLDADFDAELSALQQAVGSLDGLGSTDESDDGWTGEWDSAAEPDGSGT